MRTPDEIKAKIKEIEEKIEDQDNQKAGIANSLRTMRLFGNKEMLIWVLNNVS